MLPRLLLIFRSLHPVPSHAHLNLSSLFPKIKFCFWLEGHQIKRQSLIQSPLGWFESVLTFLHHSLLMFSTLACLRVICLLIKRGRSFIQVSRSPRSTLMTWLAIVPSRILASLLSRWSELSMPSYLSILMRINFYLLFSQRINSFSQGCSRKCPQGGVGGNDFSVRYPVVKNKKYVRRPVV